MTLPLNLISHLEAGCTFWQLVFPTTTYLQYAEQYIYIERERELRWISAICKFRSVDATWTLVCSMAFSELNYFNSLFSHLPVTCEKVSEVQSKNYCQVQEQMMSFISPSLQWNTYFISSSLYWNIYFLSFSFVKFAVMSHQVSWKEIKMII